MNREIKFRAWFYDPSDCTDGRMYYDVYPMLNNEVYIHGDIMMLDECVILEQYTGLKDKNRKEIYEGDIVKVLSNRLPKYGNYAQSKYDIRRIETRSVIVFDRSMWSIDTNTPYNNAICEPRGRETDSRRLTIRKELKTYFFYQSEIEVIGNIHEDPEVLGLSVEGAISED